MLKSTTTPINALQIKSPGFVIQNTTKVTSPIASI